MPEFDIEAPIEDAVEQSIEVGDDRPPEDDDQVPGEVPVEAPEADYVEQQLEVPEPDDDSPEA
jgi:hypothetical protein